MSGAFVEADLTCLCRGSVWQNLGLKVHASRLEPRASRRDELQVPVYVRTCFSLCVRKCICVCVYLSVRLLRYTLTHTQTQRHAHVCNYKTKIVSSSTCL